MHRPSRLAYYPVARSRNVNGISLLVVGKDYGLSELMALTGIDASKLKVLSWIKRSALYERQQYSHNELFNVKGT